MLNEFSMTHFILQLCSFYTDFMYCPRLLSLFVCLVAEKLNGCNLYQSWILLRDKKQQADRLWNTFDMQHCQINHPSHMVLSFPSLPMWQSNSPPHCWPSMSDCWPQYLQILLLSHSIDCLILSLSLCCVANRHSVKKETLRKMEFLLLRSLLFSQFWKLDIKQVSMRDQCKRVYLYKNLDFLKK